MKRKNPYTILGISKNSSKSEIIKAFRKLAHKYHPDKSSDPEANEIFRDILQAYELLERNNFKYTDKNISSISLEEIRKKMKEYEKEGLFDIPGYSDLRRGYALWNMARKKK